MAEGVVTSDLQSPVPSLQSKKSKERPLESFRKPCTLCQTSRPVLVRCQIDETRTWHMVCPGKCWKSVSGGEVDARGHEDEFPFYRYGGMWKNKHEPVSAKMKTKERGNGRKIWGREREVGGVEGVGGRRGEWRDGVEYTRNERVVAGDGDEEREKRIWICRRSHWSEEGNGPMEKNGYRYWKIADGED